MKKTMVAGVLAASVSLGLVADAATYDVVTDWAAVSSAGYKDGTGDLSLANRWTNSQSVGTVSNSVIYVDDEEKTGELVYTPTEPIATNDMQTVEMHFPSVEAGGVLADPASGTKAAMAAVNGGAVTNWYGWCAAGWTKLVGAVPPVTGSCDVRMMISNKVGKVCYVVKTGDTWTVLHPEGSDNGWLTGVSGNALTEVAFAGKTALTDVKMTQTGTMTASDTMTGRMAEQSVTAAELNDTAANGNRKWENLVLGLDCQDSASQPVVSPVQSSDASKVTLALGGVDVDTTSGATVTYTVTASDTIGGAGTTTDPIAYNENAEVPLPQTGVKYYQMKVTATPK